MNTLQTLAQCTCTLDTMVPQSEPGIDDNICQTCNGTVSWYLNDAYNRYHGYSGYDEDNDRDDGGGDYDE